MVTLKKQQTFNFTKEVTLLEDVDVSKEAEVSMSVFATNVE